MLVLPLVAMVGFVAGSGGDAPLRLRGFTGGQASVASSPGDPMLAEARAGLSGGNLPDELRAALLVSEDPEHARAQRILRAMDARPEAPTPSPNAGGDGAIAIVAPALPTGDGAVAPVSSGSRGTTGTKPAASEPAASEPAPSEPAASRPRTTISALGLR